MENKMTRRTWLQSSTAALACLALPEYALGAVAEKGGASRVWMTKEISPEALVRIYEALGRPAGGKVAVKISTGEPGGRNFLSPVLIKDLVRRVNGTIVDAIRLTEANAPGRRTICRLRRITVFPILREWISWMRKGSSLSR